MKTIKTVTAVSIVFTLAACGSNGGSGAKSASSTVTPVVGEMAVEATIQQRYDALSVTCKLKSTASVDGSADEVVESQPVSIDLLNHFETRMNPVTLSTALKSASVQAVVQILSDKIENTVDISTPIDIEKPGQVAKTAYELSTTPEIEVTASIQSLPTGQWPDGTQIPETVAAAVAGKGDPMVQTWHYIPQQQQLTFPSDSTHYKLSSEVDCKLLGTLKPAYASDIRKVN